ncbi:autotransporter assembly complex protein TamA [Mariprofundus ferrooxydans]|uniref:autotransporter assembly complex protein TamA n=1 Tax=Mariprofundus ferrooxydans TaxID=314344 RepID=UPI00142FE601|nr:BamA/TamA family outer membrane protein [Mariprofundus ferrooxydans]
MHISGHVSKPLNAGVLLRLLLLAGALLFCLPALADDASRIVNSPVAVPESLLRQMDTLRLKPSVGTGVVRYMAGQDAALIRQWLRSEGYLDAKVTPVLEAGEARWRVDAGALWRIRHVEVSPALSTHVAALPHSGDAFRSDAYEQAKSALRWAWRDAGYLKAAFDKAVVIPDKKTREVDITWHIVPGPLFYISTIHVDGAAQYSVDLAVRISQLQAGQIVTQQRLQDAMQHLSEDSRYQHAMVVPQMQQAVGNRVPLRITVSEAGWRKLSGDVGYSTDAGLGLGANWVDRSLLQGKLEYALRAQTSRTTSGAGATLTVPTWPEYDQQVGVNVDYLRKSTDGRLYDSVNGGPFWQWNFRRKDYLRLTLQAENVREAGAHLLTLGPRMDVRFSHEQGGLVPLKGWRMNFGAGLPLRVNSAGLWAVLDVSGRYFFRPVNWLLLSPRAGYGRTLNLQGVVPKTYRQFAGGATSARGYSLDSLGPVGADGLATGGLMKTYGGVDLVLMPEAELFSPLLFADAAKVWQAIGRAAPTAFSAGFGVIMRTPAGPLRLDLALPLNRRPQDKRFQFYLTLGDVF